MKDPDSPATERQIVRLKWAAKQLNQSLPKNITKEQASELIDEWFDGVLNEGLEEQWQQEKERLEEERIRKEDAALELEMIGSDVDDWREFYHCKRVSKTSVKSVCTVIGTRHDGEQLDKFMDRFFAELVTQKPELFQANHSSQKSISTMSDPFELSGKQKPQSISFIKLVFGVAFGILLAQIVAWAVPVVLEKLFPK